MSQSFCSQLCIFNKGSLWGDVRRLACRGSGGAGWERTGLAGGGLVLSAAGGGTQANQGMCIYVPALFCSEEGIPEKESRRTPIQNNGHWQSRGDCLSFVVDY